MSKLKKKTKVSTTTTKRAKVRDAARISRQTHQEFGNLKRVLLEVLDDSTRLYCAMLQGHLQDLPKARTAVSSGFRAARQELRRTLKNTIDDFCASTAEVAIRRQLKLLSNYGRAPFTPQR